MDRQWFKGINEGWSIAIISLFLYYLHWNDRFISLQLWVMYLIKWYEPLQPSWTSAILSVNQVWMNLIWLLLIRLFIVLKQSVLFLKQRIFIQMAYPFLGYMPYNTIVRPYSCLEHQMAFPPLLWSLSISKLSKDLIGDPIKLGSWDKYFWLINNKIN